MIAPAGTGEPGKVIIERCANGWVIWVGGLESPSWMAQCHVARTPAELTAIVVAVAAGEPLADAATTDSRDAGDILRAIAGKLDRLTLALSRAEAA